MTEPALDYAHITPPSGTPERLTRDAPDSADLPALSSSRLGSLPPSSPLSLPDATPSSEDLTHPQEQTKFPRQPFYISVPYLSEEQKALYRPAFAHQMSLYDDYEDLEIESVIGEYQDEEGLFYFARMADGIAYKFAAAGFKRGRPGLVEEYEQKKRKGKLPDFDPSASYVHYNSRVRLPIKLNVKNGRKSHTTQSYSESDELAMSSESNSEFAASRPLRRSTRSKASNVARGARELPFSPKKTGSIMEYFPPATEFDSSDSDVQEVPAPTRKSTRTQKQRRYKPDDDDYASDLNDVDSDEPDNYSDVASRAKTVKKKKKGVKQSRPSYGRFREIADLDEEEEDTPLRAHRRVCEKCHRKPAHKLLEDAHKPKGRRKKKVDSEEEDENDEERLTALGGWVRCLKCPVTAHWGCLAKTQRDEILKAVFERDRAEWQATQAQQRVQDTKDEHDPSGHNNSEPTRRTGLDPDHTTEFICGSCTKGGICMVCKDLAVKPDDALEIQPSANGSPPDAVSNGDVEMTDVAPGVVASTAAEIHGDNIPDELVFRCITCKRLAHYAHLPVPQDLGIPPDEVTPVGLAEHYQNRNNWQCHDCVSYVYSVEHILAWRPYPEDAVEPSRPSSEPVNHKAMLPREYLVKWADRSYRRTSWVPHGWLLATHAARLKNFIAHGSKVPLLLESVDQNETHTVQEDPLTSEAGQEEVDSTSLRAEANAVASLLPDPDAERKIPQAWKTVDRILDVLLWSPRKHTKPRGKLKSKRGAKKNARRVESDDDENVDHDVSEELRAVYETGEQPRDVLTETVNEYELRTGSRLMKGDVDKVVWAFIKWDDLGYEDVSWDSPPRIGEPGYVAFDNAFKRFLAARQIQIPVRNGKEAKLFEGRLRGAWRKSFQFTVDNQPENGQAPQFKLMPFQIDGVNWLCDNWWNHQSCILADEMGLGKTVQIAASIGHILMKYKAYPALVVVPNSTISNWVREFERWAPGLRVVPFNGEAKARDVIKRYELFHEKTALRTTGAKFHVLVTTYEMITNAKEFTPVFKNTPRWEILVVDEGQRLKNDDSLIFKKLRELKTLHRIILTGTPLNNNIRELFALMNFLDPGEWADLDALSKQYEELSEASIKELHGRLKPYFLRRIKSEVLQLPPKNEVIVPVSMAPLQQEIYRSILSQNLNILRNLVQGTVGSTVNAAVTKSNMNNILMQLRKCLQHPYLVSREIEPKGLSPENAHAKLIDASSKLGLLKLMLPKLRERGHRVLLFSQFVIALDIIEDFLVGENIKYLRLDGTTKQADRQKDMDEFNKPGSDIFIYLLTTRAGGVGINLWTADTVIIFDPDFNPHQDLQAIARAHRYGQKKTCLVFKLMVKGSAEEKIMQTGKKKLVLDHLIVQKMDDGEGSKEDMQSILMFGAQALFEDNNSEERQIHYSETDIAKLVERTEQEGDQTEPEAGAGGTFSFAKIWSADRDTLEEVPDDAQDGLDQVDSWAQTLERLAAERNQVRTKEATGRGTRRRAAAVFPQQNLDLEDGFDENTSKRKKKKKSKSVISDDSDVYAASGNASDTDAGTSDKRSNVSDALTGLGLTPRSSSPLPGPSAFAPISLPGHKRSGPPALPRSTPTKANGSTAPFSLPDTRDGVCGLCGGRHDDKPCFMTNSPENLAEYRLILLLHAGDEPLQERRAAIRAIDEELNRRGMIHLIYGQPLHLVEHPATDIASVRHKKQKQDASAFSVSSRSSASGQLTGGTQIGNSRVQATIPMPGPSIFGAKMPAVARTSGAVPSNMVAGPSKRSLSPPPVADAMQKKKKVGRVDLSACVICGQSPHHLVKDCPRVVEGPKRVKKAIRRLEGDPGQATTVAVLRKILMKQQRHGLSDAGPAVELGD